MVPWSEANVGEGQKDKVAKLGSRLEDGCKCYTMEYTMEFVGFCGAFCLFL